MLEKDDRTVQASDGICDAITLFMCGDVMTGRGIDQVLAHPSDPTLHGPYLKSALGYVKLAETANGPIDYPVPFSYAWGDAIKELDRRAPDVRIVNLETSITTSNDFWEGKGRVIATAFGLRSSGIPSSWRAEDQKPGVNVLKKLSAGSIRAADGLRSTWPPGSTPSG